MGIIREGKSKPALPSHYYVHIRNCCCRGVSAGDRDQEEGALKAEEHNEEPEHVCFSRQAVCEKST